MSRPKSQPQDNLSPSPPWSPSTKFIVTGTLLFIFMATLYFLRSMILPIIMALIVAYILHPIVTFIVNKTRIQRGIATAGVYLIIVATLISIPAATIPSIVTQVTTFIDNLPGIIEDFATFLETPPEIEFLSFTIPITQFPVDQYIDTLIGLVQTAGTQSLSLTWRCDISHYQHSRVGDICPVCLVLDGERRTKTVRRSGFACAENISTGCTSAG